jgi:hypothetical protein
MRKSFLPGLVLLLIMFGPIPFASAITLSPLEYVTDIGGLRPAPGWPAISEEEYLANFFSVKHDLHSGAACEKFKVPVEGKTMLLDLEMNAPAIAAINASPGDLFAMGVGPGKGHMNFFSPTEEATITLGNTQLHMNPVPEPETMLLLGIGLITIGGLYKRSKRNHR